MLELPDIKQLVGPFDPKTLTFPWRHPDERVDALQRDVMELIGVRINAPRLDLFEAVRELVSPKRPVAATADTPAPMLSRSAIPYLNEPWYC